MSRIKLDLTEAEAEALLGAAIAGEYEFTETVEGDPSGSHQAKSAQIAALGRAMRKLRAGRRAVAA